MRRSGAHCQALRPRTLRHLGDVWLDSLRGRPETPADLPKGRSSTVGPTRPTTLSSFSKLRVGVGPYAILAIVALAAFGSSLDDPALLGDAWGQLSGFLWGTMKCPNWQIARPFTYCEAWARYQAFGLAIQGHAAVAFALVFGNAVALFVVLNKLFPNARLFSAAVACLYLVYPSDLTQTWLVSNLRVSTLTFLMATYFLIGFWQTGRWWTFAVGLVLCLVSLAVYEAPVGLMLILSVAGFLSLRSRLGPKRVALLAPAALALLFSAWRWQYQLTVGTAFGHTAESIVLSPRLLLSRLVDGYRISLQWAWTRMVVRLSPLVVDGARVEQLLSLAIVALAVLGLMMIAIWSMRRSMRDQACEHSIDDGSDSMGPTKLGIIAVAGLLLLGAGYVPVILAERPAMDYVPSRMNHLPSIGASLFLCCLLYGVARLVAGHGIRADKVMTAGLAPLLLVGIAGRVQLDQRVDRTWDEQKQIWGQLFKLAPEIKGETQLLLVLGDGWREDWEPRPFISGASGFSGALKILYDNNSLAGRFVYGDAKEQIGLSMSDPAVLLVAGRAFPIDSTLVFAYDRQSKTLSQLQTLMLDGVDVNLAAHHGISDDSCTSKYRWLVR